ncbi:MAG: bifunctional acetate--CoA ligase family protein/GNAT family N-acetyltransferase [Candidatus Bathyarchaeota archaeon]|nr:MAG: bifunctional acetate--CoA ligase family protein/GNAT family N-acetyltransferase [Candidatus Bathyarchaeota archaeon]
MVTRDLDAFFKPRSIAIIGASDEIGSVGYALMRNLADSDYQGLVFPVNIHKSKILNHKAYQTVEQLPEGVDLAIVATPARTVPSILEQCGKIGIKGIIIVSAGFSEAGAEGKALEKRIVEAKKKFKFRIIGPNCLGLMRPSINLNATFAMKKAKLGNIAFISQSGALGTAILDLAIHENIGFSNFVSLGSTIDVDFGDLIDYFGNDPETKSILMYIEGIHDAREFMSAARQFAKAKPIIVAKSGKYVESAKAAASHTGSLTGEDVVYDAAFKRAGIVRVEEIADLFNIAEVLDMQPLPRGPRLAIITNAGGPAIMTTDALIARGGKLAKLSQKTIDQLNQILPAFWSKGNPIDILGDAKAERYKSALEVCLADENIDGLLVIFTPQGLTNPAEVARSLIELHSRPRDLRKTLLTAFMGYEEVEEANQILTKNDIPTFFTPEQAIKTYMYMYQYKHNLELLYETPEEVSLGSIPSKRPFMVIMKKAARENRDILTEIEAKQLLEYYGIPIVKTMTAVTADEAVTQAQLIGYPVVLKILSPHIVHKTDAGGVVLDINSESELREAFYRIMEKAKEYNPVAKIEGVTISPMIKKQGYEVILGAKADPVFGPIILFGVGGISVELFRDVAFGLPPLNRTLAKRIMEETKVYQILQGYRNMPAANLRLLEETMVRFSQMLVDFPQLKEVDINPLLIDDKEAFALDARIVIDQNRVFNEVQSFKHLVISPYPKKYETTWNLRNGRSVLLRPVKPEDEPLWLEMFKGLSKKTLHNRFANIVDDTPLEVRFRFFHVDYDREIGIIAEVRENNQRNIIGDVRITFDSGGKSAKIACIVADQWQGLGLGSKMLDYAIEICEDRGMESIHGILNPENQKAIKLLKKMGFKVEKSEDGTLKSTLRFNENRSKVIKK